jgi:hypothetical protein
VSNSGVTGGENKGEKEDRSCFHVSFVVKCELQSAKYLKDLIIAFGKTKASAGKPSDPSPTLPKGKGGSFWLCVFVGSTGVVFI